MDAKGLVKAEGSVSLVHWVAVGQILTIASHVSTGDKMASFTAGNVGGELSVVGCSDFCNRSRIYRFFGPDLRLWLSHFGEFDLISQSCLPWLFRKGESRRCCCRESLCCIDSQHRISSSLSVGQAVLFGSSLSTFGGNERAGSLTVTGVVNFASPLSVVFTGVFGRAPSISSSIAVASGITKEIR